MHHHHTHHHHTHHHYSHHHVHTSKIHTISTPPSLHYIFTPSPLTPSQLTPSPPHHHHSHYHHSHHHHTPSPHTITYDHTYLTEVVLLEVKTLQEGGGGQVGHPGEVVPYTRQMVQGGEGPQAITVHQEVVIQDQPMELWACGQAS